MNKLHLLKVSALLLVCCAMLGCTKETPTTIYGTVFNSITHEPIIGARIVVGYTQRYTYTTSSGENYGEEDNVISSSVSGADGQFELYFGEVSNPYGTPQHFYIKASANAYRDYSQTTGITIGSNYRMDINLDPY